MIRWFHVCLFKSVGTADFFADFFFCDFFFGDFFFADFFFGDFFGDSGGSTMIVDGEISENSTTASSFSLRERRGRGGLWDPDIWEIRDISDMCVVSGLQVCEWFASFCEWFVCFKL